MAELEDDTDKPHEATQKRLEDARRKGEIPLSADLTSAMSYLALLVLCFAFGGSLVEQSGLLFARVIQSALDGSQAPWPALRGLELISPWFMAPLAGAVLALIGQRAFVFAGEKLSPKMSRISIVSNAKQKFGRKGLVEFAKAAVKLTVFSALLFLYIFLDLERILGAAALDHRLASFELLDAGLRFFSVVCALVLITGALDYLWQRAEHLRTHRMSRKEVMDENKEQEGDPFLKSERRARAQQIANNSMMGEVADATVVVVNPTHYAVALKWDRASGGAPVCVAKGVDHVAARIREAASEAGVPIHRDPPTARALFASVELNEEIQPELYKPVAAAVRFAEKMRKRAMSSG